VKVVVLKSKASIGGVGTPLGKIAFGHAGLLVTGYSRSASRSDDLGQRSVSVSDSNTRQPAPNRLREYRLRLGLEQTDVAAGLAALSDEEIALDGNAVSRHERGRHRPTRRYRRLYCRFFHADEAELWPRHRPVDEASDAVLTAPWSHRGTVEASVAVGGSGETVERRAFLFLTGAALTAPAHQWLVQEPGRLAAALRGDRVTPELADRLPPMIAELRRMDDAHSPRVVLSLAERDFAWVSGLLDQGSYDDITGRRLHVALAELGQVVGFSSAEPVSA